MSKHSPQKSALDDRVDLADFTDVAGFEDLADLADLDDIEDEADLLQDALADSRRRFVLGYLGAADEPRPLRDVAVELAAREDDVARGRVTADRVRSVAVSLHHKHIPHLAAVGLVEYDSERNVLALASDVDVHASPVDEAEVALD